MIALEDLKGKTEDEVKQHIASSYCSNEWHNNDDRKYGDPDTALLDQLKSYKILLAYESVGNWGCDSSSLFIIRDKKTKKLYEVRGSHCSCFGFEGQWSPEEVNIEALKMRKIYFTGGYDTDEENNKAAVHDFIQKLK